MAVLGRLLLTLALFVAFALAPRAAHALENEQKVGLFGGYSTLAVSDKDTNESGAGVGLAYTYGLSDAFNMVIEGSESIVALDQKLDQPTTPHTRPAALGALGAGIVYTLDIVRLVPYGGVLAGGYWLTGGTLDHARPELGFQLAGGLDYKLTLKWSVGAGVRMHFFVTDSDTYSSFLQVFGKVEYAWGR